MEPPVSAGHAHLIRRRLLDCILTNGRHERARVVASIPLATGIVERLLNGLISESIVETDGRNCWIADLPSIPLHDVIMQPHNQVQH
ncbi:hypothetical protein [Nevskia ramosa]|uniref:hypothetical protein n=1 Tax=Nevskia ramosa TaxID=64002 RepID=UPI003D09A65D